MNYLLMILALIILKRPRSFPPKIRDFIRKGE